MTHHMNAVSLAEHQRVLSMASEFADRAEQAEAAIARVRGIPEKESDVGYPNDWHIGWNACRESVLDALEEQLTNEVPDSYIQMKARALTAEAAIARVRIEHRSDMAGIPWCYACDASWPCDTIRALDGDSDD